jgi:hypothetical protein
MPNSEYVFYSSELATLNAILSDMPEEDALERMGFEARKKEVENTISKMSQSEKKEPFRVSLTFRGKPVFESYGILADFGAKALGAFVDAVQSVAASITDKLSSSGPIPGRQKNSLLIVGPAIGSYGFELEIAAPEDKQTQLFESESVVEESIVGIIDLLDRSINGSDDEIAGIIEKIHPRAVSYIEKFLETTIQGDAYCSMETGNNHKFRFMSGEELIHSKERLSGKNIVENEVTFQGEFIGILPTARRFEFQIHGDDSVINGRITLDPDEIVKLSRDCLYKTMTVLLKSWKLGESKPRYTLAESPF